MGLSYDIASTDTPSKKPRAPKASFVKNESKCKKSPWDIPQLDVQVCLHCHSERDSRTARPAAMARFAPHHSCFTRRCELLMHIAELGQF